MAREFKSLRVEELKRLRVLVLSSWFLSLEGGVVFFVCIEVDSAGL